MLKWTHQRSQAFKQKMSGDKNPNYTWTEEKVSKLRQLYTGGLSISEIAEEFGCCFYNIYRQMVSHDIPRRSLSDASPFRGKPRIITQETRDKISNTLKGQPGRPHTEEAKLKISQARLGIPASAETRKKQSEARTGRFAGENCPSWKGGIAYLPYPFEFDWELKQQVKERDSYCCRLCGVPEVELIQGLHTHHIDYDKQNNDLDNLISLCGSCHSGTNHNRDYWESYFKELICA